jgi:hypothetical protein
MRLCHFQLFLKTILVVQSTLKTEVVIGQLSLLRVWMHIYDSWHTYD